MTSYVALLRAVNVGGTGKLPMSELKSMGEAAGFADVRTCIASGNLLFTSRLGEAAVKLNRIMGGRFTSKKCVYAPPPADQIETFRKFYGADIYPTVKQG